MQLCKKHFVGCDSIKSILIILILFLILFFTNIQDRVVNAIFDHDDFNGFILTIIQFYTTLIGFILAMLAIVLAVDSSEKLKYFKSSPYYEKVFTIFYSALGYMCLGFLFNLVLFFVKCYESVLFYIMLWLFIISGIKLYRCGWIISHLIRLSNDD